MDIRVRFLMFIVRIDGVGDVRGNRDDGGTGLIFGSRYTPSPFLFLFCVSFLVTRLVVWTL